MNQVVRRVDDLSLMLDPAAPVVTLYSGGLDGTYLLYLLARLGFSAVTALVVDVGDDDDQARIASVAASFGVRMVRLDRRAEFVDRQVLPAIRAHATYLGGHPISASLSRPVLARAGLTLAGELGAHAILHSASQSQNSLRRLNGALELLGFDGCFGTPFELSAIPRSEKRLTLERYGCPVASSRRFSIDANLWCREFESGPLDNPEDFQIPDDLYRWSRTAPGGSPCEVEIGFAAGTPTTLDDRDAAAIDIIRELNQLGGQYGIGRYVGLEQLGAGPKVLEAREAPAAALLLAAYRHLESATVDAETIREKLHVEQVWVREAVEGRWFGPLREAAEAFVLSVARAVSGTVRLRLSHLAAELTSIRAPHPKYITHREEWEARQARQARRPGGLGCENRGGDS
jgi:argininosuccinate synthase